MVLRETTFLIGGFLTLCMGVALGFGLYWAGAGFEFFPAWMMAGLAVGFGVFFIYVGRAEGRERRRALRDLETGLEGPSGPGAP